MATWIRNAVATGNVSADTRYPEIAKASWLYEDTGILGKLLMYDRQQMRKVKSNEYKCLEQRKQADWTQINAGGGYNTSATTFVMDSVAHLAPNDLFIIPRTGEMMHIRSVDYTANSIDVPARALAGTATAINDDDWVMRICSLHPQGSEAPQSNLREADTRTNYAGIIMTAVEWTNSELEEASYLSESGMASREDHDKKQALQKHTWDLDNKMLLSKKSTSAGSNGKKLLSTDGLLASILTTVYNHGGGSTMTEALFNYFLEKVGIANMGREVDMLCSMRMCSLFDSWGRAAGGYTVETGLSKELGVGVKSYLASHCKVNIIPYYRLNGYYYGRAAVVLNRRFHGLAMFRDTKYEKDVKPGIDGRKDYWVSEIGFDTKLEETLGLVDGIDTGTAAVLPGTT